MPVILLGGGAFSPLSIPTLKAWYAARLEVGLSDGNTLPQITDQSGSGFHLTTITGTPTFETNVIGGQPVYFSNAGNGGVAQRDNVGGANVVAAAAATWFGVVRLAALPGANVAPFALHDTGVAQRQQWNISAAGALASLNNDGVLDTATDATLSTDTNYILSLMHSGGNIYAGVNDARDSGLSSVASGDTNFSGNEEIYMFSITGSVIVDGFNIAEVLVYNAALTEAQRMEVERYLASIYGITLPY